MPTLLRRIVVLFILTAYIGAMMFQLAPTADAMPGGIGLGMVEHQDGPPAKMPCKSGEPPCMIDLGCMFLVSLPALPDPTLLTLTAWSSVHYLGSLDPLHGRSVKPPLGPPISIA